MSKRFLKVNLFQQTCKCMHGIQPKLSCILAVIRMLSPSRPLKENIKENVNQHNFGPRRRPIDGDSVGIVRHFIVRYWQLQPLLRTHVASIVTHVAMPTALQGTANIWQ
jgi:hypothetical protein